MPRHAAHQTKNRILAVVVVILAVFDAVVWYRVVAQEALSPAAQVDIGKRVYRPGPDSASEPSIAVPERIGLPTRIRIPSIDVDAEIEKVALTPDGAMDVPKDPLDTGWYEIGPRPGETGSAAIAGHVDWYDGATAVFRDLHKVKPGDTITVEDEKGMAIAFLVREIRKYDAAADALEVFSSNDGKSHLNLITCIGDWDRRARQYAERLVVFADRLE